MTPPVSRWPEAAVTLARTFGVRGASLRALHEARRAAGRFRLSPRHPVLTGDPACWLVVDRESLRSATDHDVALARADRVVEGEYQAFRHTWRPLPETPEDWLRQPTSGQTAPREAPWWKAEHLQRSFGDIKEVWEPARFGWLYDLVRGYLVTENDRYARAALHHITQWAESAPPFRGLHWSCGQETAIRAVALLYAEANLSDAPSWAQTDRKRVAGLLAASGERIADAIGYAVSQRNNHALSEATGLVMLGVRFRNHHPEAEEWLATGHAWLDRLIPEQFAADGWYIQHSFTYARLAIEQCALAEHALRYTGRQLTTSSVRRILAATNLLASVTDAETGHVPVHGANDGAYVLPVSLAEYRDFRPVLTAVATTWEWPIPAGMLSNPEVPVWLGGSSPTVSAERKRGLAVGPSGWAVASVGETQVFLRAGRYASRPAHLDSLHITVRFGLQEVVVDAGSYSYNARPPWNNGLTTAAAHNGPLLDGREPGIRGPRFLWYQWPQAGIVDAESTSDEVRLVAERAGVVRRSVRVRDGLVEVQDEALAPGSLQTTWLLAPGVSPLCIDVGDAGHQLVAAQEGAVAGWVSPHYGERIPSQSVTATSSSSVRATIVTRISSPSDLS